MAKTIYEKPMVEYVTFYSKEEIASKQEVYSIDYYANEQSDGDNSTIVSTVVGGGSMEEGIV